MSLEKIVNSAATVGGGALGYFGSQAILNSLYYGAASAAMGLAYPIAVIGATALGAYMAYKATKPSGSGAHAKAHAH